MSETDQNSVLAAACSCGSGRPLRDCHGAPGASPAPQEIARRDPSDPPGDLRAGTEQPGELPRQDDGISISKPPVTRRLDLACGQSPREGFEGVDIWPGAQHVVDLQLYPWPFESESVLELHCSHYIEHIPMEMVLNGYSRICPSCNGSGILPESASAFGYAPVRICRTCQGTGAVGDRQDALFAFFDECWRILVPDGWLRIVVPAHRSDRAFQDPTHRRFITAQTFAYTNQEWRQVNKLDHYNVACNFVGDCNPVVDQSLVLRAPEVAQQRILRDWNVVLDWTAQLQKKPRLTVKVG